MKNWIGVDLDGTLAAYGEWKGVDDIGEPIPLMVKRVKQWLAEGKDVRIFTARVWSDGRGDQFELARTIRNIEEWCLKHLGAILPITNAKDFAMAELWDDRCHRVESNTGRLVGPI